MRIIWIFLKLNSKDVLSKIYNATKLLLSYIKNIIKDDWFDLTCKIVNEMRVKKLNGQFFSVSCTVIFKKI